MASHKGLLGRFLLGFLPFAPLGLGQPSSTPLALTHVTVLPMTHGGALRDMTVLIEGGHIVGIGAKVSIPPAANVVDETGRFLIPGLRDMHAHIFNTTDLSLFVANGVTGVRVMAWLPKMTELHEAVDKGKMLGPHMSITGRLIGGPLPSLVEAALGQSAAESAKEWVNITTGLESQPRSFFVRSPDEARAAVIQSKRDGGEAIKIHEGLSRQNYLAIVDETKKQGMTFVGHVPESVSAAEASNLGQRSIEHSSGVLLACSKDETALRTATEDLAKQTSEQRVKSRRDIQRRIVDTFSDEKEAALAQTFRKNGTWQCPTLTLSSQSARELRTVAEPRLKYISSELRAKWRKTAAPSTGTDEVAELYNQCLFNTVSALKRQGDDFLTGTDSGAPFTVAGFSLHDELETLVAKAGFTPYEALEAATINGARFLAQDKRSGTVEIGKEADLVVLDANPIDAIANSRKIRAVIVRGQIIDRQALDQLLTQVAATNAVPSH
jgi:imidazolonepropionase-like amidohydrolase